MMNQPEKSPRALSDSSKTPSRVRQASRSMWRTGSFCSSVTWAIGVFDVCLRRDME
jgi:hypothetical protein